MNKLDFLKNNEQIECSFKNELFSQFGVDGKANIQDAENFQQFMKPFDEISSMNIYMIFSKKKDSAQVN